MLINRIHQTLLSLGLVVLGSHSEAATLKQHFWPGPIVQEDTDASGSLFAWPDYTVLLQNKIGEGEYTPASLSDALAAQLSLAFKAPTTSPIVPVRDPVAKTWGLSIRGGSTLTAANAVLIDAMNNSFVNCLASLTVDEMERMKSVIYAPASFLNPSTGLPQFDDELKHIAGKMFDNYKAKRCEGGTTTVPGLVKQTSKRYFTTLLTGAIDITVNDGVQLVLVTLYKDLLFSSNGLWVRTTLAELQKFIGDVLARNPVPTQTTWLERDYTSFVDFVLLTRDNSGLSKDQYLTIASICGVDEVSKIFGSFALKQCSGQGQLTPVHLYLGKAEGVLLLAGAGT